MSAPEPVAGERADLLQSLARQRHFLRHTTRGLTDEQAARQTTASELSLGGLIKRFVAGAARFPGVLLPRRPLRACCYRSGSADAARSRATAPATTRAEPAAILSLRRCTARGTRRT